MSRKVFDQLSDVFSHIANRKSRAAKARFSGTPIGVEHSKDVYLDSCAKIAGAFKNEGFIFAKSGPHLSRRTKNFTYKISFQTSHHNIPGEHVALLIAAQVRSSLLKKWRSQQQNPYRKDDWVAGGLVHLLENEHTFVQWELADPLSRDEVITDIINYLNHIVLPYFAKFENPTDLIDQLIEIDIPCFELGSSIEFALCFGEKSQAEKILDRFIKARPDLSRDIERSYKKFKEKGLPDGLVGAYADQVAWVRLSYDLV